MATAHKCEEKVFPLRDIDLRAKICAMKKFYIRTYGCQMNELDTEIMAGILKKRGMEPTDDENVADLLIFNTCSIRDLAERKAMGKMGILARKAKKSIIGVTGCMAMAKKESLFKKLPNIDFVLGTNNITDLDQVLDEVLDNKKGVIRAENQFEENLNYMIADRADSLKAYVSIIRGCDKFCTYCVVPYTRGQEVSRAPESILEECRKLADTGYKEICLLGQNVNSYGKDQPGWNCLFHDLLERIDQIDGIERVRFMTSHPIDITTNLMQAIRDLPSACEFIHFPIQAGSSRILKKMHRIYSKEQYFETVAKFREIVPDVSLGTDIIVGFPTETEEEFEETMDVFRKLRYSIAFLYSYSARKGTPAYRWRDDIPEEVKQDRLHRLMALNDQISSEIRGGLIGQELEILVEKVNAEGQVKGRSRCWKKVLLSGTAADIGTLKKAKIHSYTNQTLIAK